MKIGVVIVTFNRLEKLKKTLDCFEKQTKKPLYLVVVDNCSTDGTDDYLKEWKTKKSDYNKYVIKTSENLGGSGGFYNGLEFALKEESDWIWLSDDDAFPQFDAIENCYKFINSYEEINNISAFCGKVMNNGKIDHWHRKFLKKGLLSFKTIRTNDELYNKEYFKIDQLSYVGCVLNKKVLEKVGITNKDYFIFYDDAEHSYRLREFGDIICVPSIVINHDTLPSEYSDWKLYYHTRNKLLFYKRISKRYFIVEKMKESSKLLIKKIIRFKPYKHKIISDAIKDASNNVLGKHKVYIPGWKFSK